MTTSNSSRRGISVIRGIGETWQSDGTWATEHHSFNAIGSLDVIYNIGQAKIVLKVERECHFGSMCVQSQIRSSSFNFMEHIHNNIIKLGGSLGNVPRKNEKLVIKTRYISDC
jgi:hypothetical protein